MERINRNLALSIKATLERLMVQQFAEEGKTMAETDPRVKELFDEFPGALPVIMKLIELQGERALDLLESSGIKGKEIWYLFRYCCNQDYNEVWYALMGGEALDFLKTYPNSRYYEKKGSHYPDIPQTNTG